MRKVMAALVLLVGVCIPALADKARGISTEADEAFHADHLLRHINQSDCRVTGNYIKVRADSKSSARVIGHVEQADSFVLLDISGSLARIRVVSAHESSPDSWAGLEGWVTAAYVDCSCPSEAYLANAAGDDVLVGGFLPQNMPCRWYFCSGAGAWSTDLTIMEDGSFEGYYHDWDGGEVTEEYPQGTLQECEFSGQLSVPERISPYEYRCVVTSLTQRGKRGETEIRDGMLVITASPYGIGLGDSLIIYLPGTPLNRIPPAYGEWAYVANDDRHTLSFALYNMTDAYGWNQE